MVRPLQSFIDEEASSGIALLFAALVALVWANSPWRASYENLWTTSLSLSIGGWSITEDLRHWVNDGLMALFFLVVGLEIKRELLTGELRDPRAAVVPIVAAVGGMAVPALVYVAVNAGTGNVAGWGIPIATDIAFAVGVLTIAARHAPAGLKPFLLTLAIVDDIGAIVVIAIFYSHQIAWQALGVAAGLCVAIVVLQRIQVRAAFVYVGLGIVLWIAFFESGVHPAVAGVLLGLLTPAVPFQRPRAVSEEAHRVADLTVDDPEPPDVDAHQWLWLTSLSREAVSPLARVEHLLHPWTSLLVIPLFALANAGIRVSADAVVQSLTGRVGLGIILGLVVGKLVGVVGAGLGAVRFGFGRLPSGMQAGNLVGIGSVAGIGFTVAIFIAELAFVEPAVVEQAKLAVVIASMMAGILSWGLLRLLAKGSTRDEASSMEA